MPSPSRSFARLASCVFGVFIVVSLLFIAGCSSSNSNTPPPPTTPTLSAAVSSLGSVSPGQTGASYTITVSNAAGSAATSGTITVTDPPTNFTVTAIAGTGWTCTLATLTCTRSDALAAGQSYPPITVTGNVTGAAGQSISIPITISGGGLTANVTSSPSVAIVSAPSITKAFNPTSIGLNANSTLKFTITNPSANTVAEAGVAFSDTLPSGMVVATPNGLANTCSGTATATAGSGSISLSGGTVAAAGTCTVTVNVTGTAVGVLTNTSGAVSSTNGGTGNTGSANLTVVAFPTISKAFGASSIQLNASTSLTFTITNPAANTANLSGVAFTDPLPSGLVVATPNGLVNNCGGTAAAIAASGTVSLTGATVATNSNCTLSVNVTGTTAGTKSNTTGAISSTQSGAGAVSNTATLNVIAPPAISKAFGATGVAVNGNTSLTFTITNPAGNTVALNGVAFTDTMPTGLVVATTPGVTDTCGGTVTAPAGSGTIALSGGTVAAQGSCTVSVTVTATAAGNFTNTTGAVSSTNGGTGNTATANLSAALPPTISKAFNPVNIALNGTTSLTFTITNPAGNPAALTGVAFTDTLPAGLVVATPNGLTNTCNGTATATAGAGSVTLAGGTVAVSGTCTIAVNVTGKTAGALMNTTGAISSTQSGPGAVSNTATLTVIAPPTISKNFGAASVPVNTSTSLSFTITNPNASNSLSGVAFTDTLPTGMSVSTPNGLTGSCGTGTITATAGSNSVSLSGGTLAQAGSCNFSVNVTPTVAGANLNTTGNVSSAEGGTGTTASATLSAIGPPSISKAFGATGVAVNGTTTLSFTITNPNTVTLNGVAFTDSMPTGLVVAATPNITDTCGGTVTANASSGSVSLSGGSVSQSTNCTVTVNVTANAAGSFVNTTGAVSSTNGGTGNTGTATLNAAAPPTISKAFGASTIPLNGTASLTFTITNPAANAAALTGVAFSDTLPTGLVVATPNGLVNTCGGTATATAGSSSASLSGATVAANSSCTMTVNVKGSAGGVLNNTTGAISSTQSGAGATSNTATLTVVAPPTISKAFGASAITLNATTSLTFTITNPNTSSPLSGIAFNDSFPSGLIVAATPSVANNCGGTVTATASSNSVSLSGGTLASGSCTISLNVTGTIAGAINNTTGAITSTEGGTGATSNTAPLTVFATPTISMLSANSGAVGSSLTITGTNFGSTQAQGSGTVTVNGVTATATSWSSTSITVTVPTGATGTGNVIVTVLGVATATSSATQFTVVTCSTSCTLSGTVSGPQISGVTITITGPAPSSNTTIKTTDSSGNYTATLASGSYLVTPSLPGYTFSPPAPNINLTGNTTQDFTETSAQTSYSISGTVSYAGSKTGRVFVLVLPSGCNNCNAVAGTSIALTGSVGSMSGTYTVRGLLPSGSGQNGNGSFTVLAEMDTLSTGQQNDSDPSGTYPTTVNVPNPPANVTGINVTLTDPTPPAPVALDSTKISVNPGNGVAVIQYKAPLDQNGGEIATAYKVYYGTDNPPTNGAGSPKTFSAQGHNQNVFVLGGLANGATNFQLSALVGATESAKTSVFSTTIGATTGNFTVSGTVTVPSGAGNGPLYVGVYGGSSGHSIYVERIAQGYGTSVPYSVSGVPAGTYQNFAIIDENSNGEIGVPDLDNVGNHGNTPTITVTTSNITNANLDLTPQNVPSSIGVSTIYQTSCGSSSPCYNLNFQVNWGTKRPVSITMVSGANMPVPFDMSVDENNSTQSTSFATAPNVGDTYQFQVLFSDGTSQTLSGSVTAVLGAAALAQTISETTTTPYSRTVPLFTWSAPVQPPSGTYYYSICVNNINGSPLNWCDYGHGSGNGLPSSQTSIQYNADGSASSPSLTSGTQYNINIGVIDSNGNNAITNSTYTP